MGRATVFACTNHAPRLNPNDFLAITEICAAQMIQDFAPAWEKRPPSVMAWPNGKAIPSDSDAVRFVWCDFRNARSDDPDGALAYHWIDPKARPYIVVLHDRIMGQPKTKVDDVCIAAGHEIIETENDEFASQWADRGDGTEEPYECCDRVQELSYIKTLRLSNKQNVSMRVTNFLLPDAFNYGATSGPFDFMKFLKTPGGLAPGGYYISRKVGTDETQVLGDKKNAWAYSHKTLARCGVLGAGLAFVK